MRFQKCDFLDKMLIFAPVCKYTSHGFFIQEKQEKMRILTTDLHFSWAPSILVALVSLIFFNLSVKIRIQVHFSCWWFLFLVFSKKESWKTWIPRLVKQIELEVGKITKQKSGKTPKRIFWCNCWYMRSYSRLRISKMFICFLTSHLHFNSNTLLIWEQEKNGTQWT